MTSSILCAQTGIDTEEEFANSASYIASWLNALRGDNKLVVHAPPPTPSAHPTW